MKSWQHETGDVLLIKRNNQEVVARVADFEESLDDTSKLYVNLRIADGKAWGTRKYTTYKENIIKAMPDWYEQQRKTFEAELKANATEIIAKMAPAERRSVHQFAVEHGLAAEQRTPLDILIDRAVGKE